MSFGRYHFKNTRVPLHHTSVILADSLQDAMSQATFSMVSDTDPFRCQPSITHWILAGNRFHQMRAIPRRPCVLHEDMAPSHSKSLKEKEQISQDSILIWQRKSSSEERDEIFMRKTIALKHALFLCILFHGKWREMKRKEKSGKGLEQEVCCPRVYDLGIGKVR